jgi:hypothetical protein
MNDLAQSLQRTLVFLSFTVQDIPLTNMLAPGAFLVRRRDQSERSPKSKNETNELAHRGHSRGSSTIFSTSMSVGNSTIPDYRWHIEDAPAARLMRNRVIANNPRPPKELCGDHQEGWRHWNPARVACRRAAIRPLNIKFFLP